MIKGEKRMIKVYNDIRKIRDDWNKLYDANPKLTPYQSYDWNRNLQKRHFLLYTDRNRYKIDYIVYYDDNNSSAKIIAPLLSPKNGKDEITILGNKSKAGELNFIYSKDVNYNDFDNIFKYIKTTYPNQEVLLFEIPRFTELGDYLYNNKNNLFVHFFQRDNVKSLIPETVEELNKNLSKSVRQTIRTSYNRIARDNLEHKLEINYGYKFSLNELKTISAIHNKRKKQWGYEIENETDIQLLTRIKQLARDTFFDPFFMFSENNNFLYVKYLINDKIAAFFIALKKENDYCIVPTLIHDTEYDFYSPGLLMIYEFLCYEIDKKNIRTFNLSRGSEPYKIRYLPYPETYVSDLWKFNSKDDKI